jgi:hypothetical protein
VLERVTRRKKTHPRQKDSNFMITCLAFNQGSFALLSSMKLPARQGAWPECGIPKGPSDFQRPIMGNGNAFED